jgi:hypothetical protein
MISGTVNTFKSAVCTFAVFYCKFEGDNWKIVKSIQAVILDLARRLGVRRNEKFGKKSRGSVCSCIVGVRVSQSS